MMIFKEKKLIFISTPKTGTSSMEAALREYADISLDTTQTGKHFTINEVTRRYSSKFDGDIEDFDSYRVVAFIREPIEWILSWYRFRRQIPLEQNGLNKDIGFIQFFFNKADWNVFNADGTKYLQRQFFTRPNWKMPEFLFRYEDIDLAFDVICAELDITAELPVLNRSKVERDQVVLPDMTRKHLEDFYRDDYKIWSDAGAKLKAMETADN